MPIAHSAYVAQVKYWMENIATDTLDQSPPVQNTWYTVIEDKLDQRFIFLVTRQENDEVAAKDVQVRVTADGVVHNSTAQAENANTWYTWYSLAYTDYLTDTTSIYSIYQPTWLGALDLKVEVRMTSVPGTNQVLKCRTKRESRVAT